MKLTLCMLGLLQSANSAYAQLDSTRSATHIFWNDRAPIRMEDFEDSIGQESNRWKCDSIDLCWGACVGLFSVVDEPKKNRKRGKLNEQVYFAPAFEPSKSYRFNNDTIDYLTQLMVFDVYELTARRCRMALDSYYKQIPAYGTKLLLFMDVEKKNKAVLKDIIASITHEIYIEKKENAYQEWRNLITELLWETQEYATTPEDRMRFISDKPILKGYQMAETLYDMSIE